MVSLLIFIVIALIIVGLITWLIQTFVPAPTPTAGNVKMAVIYIIWVVFLIWMLLQLAGAFGASFPHLSR